MWKPGMSNFTEPMTSLPPEQQAIRDKCFHPTGTFVEFPKEEVETSIPERFEKIVRMYPDRLAVRSAHQELTYFELNNWANQIAHARLAYSDKQEEPIALLLETDAPAIATILGILKAGKMYVPMDTTLPHARLAYILEDSQAGLLITNSTNVRLARELAQSRVPVINLDELDPSLSAENPRASISPHTLTWILYTSGSTGLPKGVVQNHRNVLHYVRNYTNSLHICTDDRLTLLFSFSANAAAHNTFSALLNGASLHPFHVKEEGLARTSAWLRRDQLTIYASAPTVFRLFVETLTADQRFPHLRVIKLMGEAVSKGDVELYRRYFSPECVLINRLGSTETGTIRWFFIDKKIPIDGNVVPVGYPVEDNEILLLDDTGREAQAESSGEIAVESSYLTPGYWRRPELTAGVFMQAGAGSRIYRTGDMGRMGPDGRLYYLGRKDSQIKIRGHRVEIAEIEMALLNLGTIQAAVVSARKEPSDDYRLVAYLVAKEKPAPTVSKLRRALAGTLPEHMIPATFVVLDALPVAPNGKLDRKALPDARDCTTELDTGYVAPRTVIEAELAQIWAEVLTLNQVGIYDNFFDLGGHSLAAMRVVSQVIKEFQLELPLQSLLQSPTVAEMAAVITKHQGKQVGEVELERMLGELELMSDEEAQQLVVKETVKG